MISLWKKRKNFFDQPPDIFRKRRTAFRPQVEQLEEKVLLSVFSPTYLVYPLQGHGHQGPNAPASGTAYTGVGLTPTQVRNAYGISGITFQSSGGLIAGDGSGTTIAIVDAYDDPSISADLANFDQQLGVAAPPSFTKIGISANGTASTTNFPSANQGWAGEIELDVEWAHAIAPGANILLVEAHSAYDSDLMRAVDYARNLSGVVAVSMSWGGSESSGETVDDSHFTTPVGHAGVTFFASSGDASTIGYPAISSHVVAVGGTTLTVNSAGNYIGESAWSGSAGGLSHYVTQPSYQANLVIHNGSQVVSANGMRAGPDVAYDADPATGVAVYGTYGFGGWAQIGGTSAGSPQWAALMAIVDQGRAAAGQASLDGYTQTLPALYQLPNGDFHDITSGSNGNNLAAGPGFDLVTGRGSPVANALVAALAGNGPVMSGPVIVANGQAGYSETGTWGTESYPGDYGGTDRYATSAGNGNNTATWQVSGLPAGQYTVQANWPAYFANVSNAPYAIYDGTTLLQTVLVDETQQPVGTAYGGAAFQQIAIVNISSGTLKVVLSNTGTTNAWLIANAVRIAPIAASTTDLNWSASGDGITGPASVNTQAPFTINRTYTISGAAAPSSFTIAYYASTSSSTSQNLSQAILLGNETISAAGDLAVGNHAGTSPAFQMSAIGSYYLFAKLNASNNFLESDGINDTNDLAVTATATAVSAPVVSGPVIVANGQPGYSETGTWGTESYPADYGGTDRYATGAGNGNNSAAWQVSGLPAGQYAVQVNWPGYFGNVSNGPYAIYDGTTLLKTVLVDETQQAAGAVYGGATFQQIAIVNILSGTLKVGLSNTATTGAWLIANAVRIAPTAASATDLNWSATGDGITGPASVSAQTTFTINRTYTVSGAAAPSSFTIAYYASTSPSTSQNLSQAILLGTETISAASGLALGNHAGTSPPFQISANGGYYLFAKLNATNDFLESDGASDANDLAVTASATAVSGPVIVANGQAGYSETGTWGTESYPGDYGGTDRYATSAGNGNNTATWQVSGLPAGQYTVQVNWPAYFANVSNAPYAIYDGTTLLQTVLVDETQQPAGAVYGGAPFQQIATVTISSGTLKVVLSNTGTNNAWLIANAVRIAPA